eukprot:3965103-Pyramimonas_sp.AAC.1
MITPVLSRYIMRKKVHDGGRQVHARQHIKGSHSEGSEGKAAEKSVRKMDAHCCAHMLTNAPSFRPSDVRSHAPSPQARLVLID